MKFLYLIPPPNKYYHIRDEEFIANELKKEGQDIIKIKRFFKINIFYNIIFNKPDAIIFSSLNIGRKINCILKILRDKINIPIYWWYFDSANVDNKRLNRVISVAKNVSKFG